MITNEDDLLHFVECLPADDLTACTTSGSNDAAVKQVIDTYQPDICSTFAREYIESHGLDDVESMDHHTLEMYCVWLSAWNLAESNSEGVQS